MQKKSKKSMWKETDIHTPDISVFTGQPGLQLPIPENPTALDFFSLFIDNELIIMLVEQANLYAKQYLEESQLDLRPRSRAEMIKFLALTLLMGIVKKPDYQMYWAKDPVVQTPFFSSVMPRGRYLILLQFLHIADNS